MSTATCGVAVGDAVRYDGRIYDVAAVEQAGMRLRLLDGCGRPLGWAVNTADVERLVTIKVAAKPCCGELPDEQCNCDLAALIALEAAQAPVVTINPS